MNGRSKRKYVTQRNLSAIRVFEPEHSIGDTVFRYEPAEQTAEMQRERDLAERFIREGGVVYRDGKPWATAAAAEPKDDEPGGYVSQLTSLPEDWQPPPLAPEA